MSTLKMPVAIHPDPLMDAVALYIHIPFCHVKCPYCDFNTYAGMMGWRGRYIDAVIREIVALGRAVQAPDGAPRRCQTIFFGGGTPSLLPAHDIARVIGATQTAFALDKDAEISLEGNPGRLERRDLGGLRATGVNRLSLGAQSFDAELLQWLGRIHTAAEIQGAVRAARRAGFENINLDLMFALPGQSLGQWQETVKRAVDLAPEHFSLYSLIVEPSTPLFDWVERGEVTEVDQDLAADMYVWAQEYMATAGYEQYEISNWCRSGYACRHNLAYWRMLPYLGVGAGAHSCFNGRRFANVRPIETYVRAVTESWQPQLTEVGAIGGPVEVSDALSSDEMQSETVILALRLHEGLDLAEFQARYREDAQSVYGRQIAELERIGLVVLDNDVRRLRLTDRGRLVGNEVFERFLPA